MKMNLKKKITYKIKKNTWQGLSISNSAIQQIKNLMKHNIGMLGLRIDIKKYGCAGFGYTINKVVILNDNDLMYEYKGIKLFVTLKAMPLIDGTQLDYVQEGLNHMFKFNNPKAQFVCGCGNSFNI